MFRLYHFNLIVWKDGKSNGFVQYRIRSGAENIKKVNPDQPLKGMLMAGKCLSFKQSLIAKKLRKFDNAFCVFGVYEQINVISISSQPEGMKGKLPNNGVFNSFLAKSMAVIRWCGTIQKNISKKFYTLIGIEL